MEFIDEYDNILNLRNNGLLPKKSYSNDNGAFDYNYGLTEQQIAQLENFNNKFYSQELLSENQKLLISQNLSELDNISNDIFKQLSSFNGKNINDIIKNLYESGASSYKLTTEIEEKLFESKKDELFGHLRDYFPNKISYDEIIFNNSIINTPQTVSNLLKKKYYPDYPNVKLVKKDITNMYTVFDEIHNNINAAFWKTYSHELKFIDNLVQKSNNNMKKLCELEEKFNDFNYDESILKKIDELSIELKNNTIKNITSDKELNIIFEEEINKLMESYEGVDKDFVITMLKETLNEVKLHLTLINLNKTLENILI